MKILRTLILGMMNRMLANYATASPIKKWMISMFMHHFPGQITCEEFGDLMSDYLDDTMTSQVARKFEFHLQACPMCRDHLTGYRLAVKLARAALRDPPADIPAE